MPGSGPQRPQCLGPHLTWLLCNISCKAGDEFSWARCHPECQVLWDLGQRLLLRNSMCKLGALSCQGVKDAITTSQKWEPLRSASWSMYYAESLEMCHTLQRSLQSRAISRAGQNYVPVQSPEPSHLRLTVRHDINPGHGCVGGQDQLGFLGDIYRPPNIQY